MVSITSRAATELIAFLVEPGELLLETINKVIEQHDIRNGMVVSGIGTLKRLVYHYVTTCGFPPDEGFRTVEAPMELSSLAGIIADGRPHLHFVASVREEAVHTGHLENNTEVLYLAEIVILKCNELRMKRRRDEARALSLLGPG
ncbi:MAG: DNA-binding protein [Kiritimatiellae bacterium]|nr:DNA-binding protein [Kiritimatiellia bacterium]